MQTTPKRIVVDLIGKFFILPPHTKKETHPQLIALGIMLLSILIIDIMGYYHGNMTLLEVLKNL